MANDLSSRQWRLDTPVAFGSPGAILWRGNIRCRQAVFSQYVTGGADQAILKDQNGKTVWSATGASDKSPVRIADIGWVNGLVLDTLTSGLVEFYVG